MSIYLTKEQQEIFRSTLDQCIKHSFPINEFTYSITLVEGNTLPEFIEDIQIKLMAIILFLDTSFKGTTQVVFNYDDEKLYAHMMLKNLAEKILKNDELENVKDIATHIENFKQWGFLKNSSDSILIHENFNLKIVPFTNADASKKPTSKRKKTDIRSDESDPNDNNLKKKIKRLQSKLATSNNKCITLLNDFENSEKKLKVLMEKYLLERKYSKKIYDENLELKKDYENLMNVTTKLMNTSHNQETISSSDQNHERIIIELKNRIIQLENIITITNAGTNEDRIKWLENQDNLIQQIKILNTTIQIQGEMIASHNKHRPTTPTPISFSNSSTFGGKLFSRENGSPQTNILDLTTTNTYK